MTGRGLALVVLAALLTASGNLMLREGVMRAGGLTLSRDSLVVEAGRLLRQPLFDIGVLLYASASVVWFRIVSTEKLNTSYPLLVAITFLFVTSAATLIFHEPLSKLKVLGLAAILAGIALVSRS